MLDSLVRVSRRVRWMTDLLAIDCQVRTAADTSTDCASRSHRALASTYHTRTHDRPQTTPPYGRPRIQCSLGHVQSSQREPSYNTRHARSSQAAPYPGTHTLTSRQLVMALCATEKCTRRQAYKSADARSLRRAHTTQRRQSTDS